MELHPLAPEARLLFHVQSLSRLVFGWGPMLAIAAVGLAVFWQVFGALVVVGAAAFLLFVLALWTPSLAFERWGYLLRDDDLLIVRGVLLRRVTTIPLHRIQHVDLQQGPFEQYLGLARLHVHTASGVGADGVVPGLHVDDAERLRDALVRRSQSPGDDGV